ncbi:MAG: methylmalonyl-CoA mutase family protein [Flavobacteriales bacterium]
MDELNFEEFEPANAEQWLQLVKKELGERSVDSLGWEVEEGISIEPYYTEAPEDFSLEYNPDPEQFQLISHTNAKEWNRMALDSLMGGTNALGLDCAAFAPSDLPALLQGIEVAYISLSFVHMKDPSSWVEAFREWCAVKSIETAHLQGSFEYSKPTISQEEMKAWHALLRSSFPCFRIRTIDVAVVHESGGSIVQELAWALAAGHSALATLIEAGVATDEASACVQFNFATGSSYFPQIAKLRAFRWMWKRIVESYTPEHACSVHTFVRASTSRYLQTAKDKHNNLLRSTTQAMSAFIGGANSVDICPYNAWSQLHDESALRWARNIQQLMLEESYFGQHKTAADGSYAIESLTGKFVETAWKEFQCLDSVPLDFERFSKDIASFAEKQQQLVKEGKRVVVGVNRYVNKSDAAVVDGQAQTLSAPFEKA